MYCQNHKKSLFKSTRPKNWQKWSWLLDIPSWEHNSSVCLSEDTCFLLQFTLLPLGQALKVWATYAQQPLEVHICQVILKQERRQETVRLTPTAGLLSLHLCEQNLFANSSPHLSPNQSSLKTQKDYKTGLSNLLNTPVTPTPVSLCAK